MSSTRDFTSPGIFAEDATTTIPPTPIAGVAYRDALNGTDDVPNGWRYGTRVNSQDWNQIMFLLTSLAQMQDKQGLLGWSDAVDYAVPAMVFGSNGLPYVAVQASGPSTAPQDPTTAPLFWIPFTIHGQIVLTTTQSWSVPLAMQLGYIRPVVTVYGGGGGGGHVESTTLAGGGGGSGGAGKMVLDLTGVPTVSVTIGAGGAGAPSGASAAGSSGGTTSFGAFISCTGGSGGGNPSAGVSGTPTGASQIIPLASPGCGATTGASAVSGAGGGYGGEGAAITSLPLGRNGRGIGGGGAGGGGTAGTRGGGNGAAGTVIIEW